MANGFSPCMNCIDRELHCHSICAKYIEFSAQAEEIREIRHKEIENKGVLINSVTRNRKGNNIIT